jgi:hypothetical protein
MGNKAVRAQATSKNGDQVTVHSQETDAPILPVAQLQHLHEFRPDLVDFVIEQTREEARHRRVQDTRVNWFIFVERVFGQLAAIVVAVLGIGGGIYAGLNGQPWLGGTIASVTIGTLAVAFLRRNQTRPSAPSPKK